MEEPLLETEVSLSLTQPLIESPNYQRPFFSEGSLKASVFNLTNATLGAGIISVPYAFMTLGIIPGILVTFVLAGFSMTATKLLVIALDCTSAISFEHLAYIVAGKETALAAHIVMILFNFGAAVGYLICCGDIFTVIAETFALTTFPIDRKIFLTAVALCILLPLCLVDTLGELRGASLAGLVALELLVISTLILVFTQGPALELGLFPFPLSFWPPSWKFVFQGIPLLIFAFSCQSNAPSIYNELERHCYRRMAKVATRSVAVAFITYLVVGVSGYLTYGRQIQPNILLNFTGQLKDSKLLLMAFTGTLIGVLFSFPMSIFPCRGSIELLFYPHHEPVPPIAATIIVVTLVGLSLVVALLVPSLAVVFGLTGSTCGACIVFIFPGLFILLLSNRQILNQSQKLKIKALVLIGTGIFTATFGTLASIYDFVYTT